MEDLDLTERTPFDTGPVATIPLPKLVIEPLAAVRPDGTRTRRALPPPIPGRATKSMPVVPPPNLARASVPPPIPRLARASIPPPIPARDEEPSIHQRLPEPPVIEPTPVIEQPASPKPDFVWNGSAIAAEETYQAPRTRRLPARYVVGAGIAGAATFALVAFAVTRGGDAPVVATVPAPLQIAPVPPKPAPVPAPKPIEAPAAKPIEAAPVEAGTDVSITSWPSGATVTLVDDGNARVIGKTPLVARIDPARSYDVVVAAHDRPTAMRHLEVGDRELLVDLDPEPVTLPEPPPAPKKVVAKPAPVVQVAAPKPKQVAPAPKQIAPPPKQVASAPKPVASNPALANAGTLDASAKPPCEILIDGKSTRLTTPQRGIALTPGAHSITFKNAAAGIQKSFVVRIEKGKATKLIQNLMR